MTMSVPYGLPSTCSSIQVSSVSSSSGVKASAPSTPRPPARLTAATTSRQWENAKIGNSMPNMSQTGVRTAWPPGLVSDGASDTSVAEEYGAGCELTTGRGVRDPDARADRRDQREARRDDGDVG